MSRRYIVLAPDHFVNDAKTAHGVIRYGTDEIVAVIDPACAGQTVRNAVPYLPCDAPIVATVEEALAFNATSLLVGTAPMGGALPGDWRAAIKGALRAGLEVVSGLHQLLATDPEFAEEARRSDATIWDVREPPAVPLFRGDVYAIPSPVVLMVGNDCAVGKMTAALELAAAARSSGKRAAFVPTGQTGIMIAGWGISVDRVIADFAPGAAEQLVMYAAQDGPDVIFVEGQGAINHPAYGPVTLALMYGSAPDALVMVCDPQRATMHGFHVAPLAYGELIRIHETLLAPIKPARVVGIALNTYGMSDESARAEIERARRETSLPADDIVRFGARAFYDAIAPALVKTAAIRAGAQ